MNRFRVKTDIRFGQEALAMLRELAGRRVLIVTDAFMATTDLMKHVKEQLSEATVEVFDGVKPDPSVDVVGDGLKVYLTFDPDAVVALGGGSPIDTAKAVYKIALEQNDAPELGLIVIPTTSGSGSEVTSFAVVTDAHQHKIPLISDDMLPDVAILDPMATLTLPPGITADTGMDVTTHAIEAYGSVNANDFTDAVAEKALQLVFNSLPVAHSDGANTSAREDMLNASCLAGMAFENAGLGIVHSLAHALGGKFHLPHGRLNALLLPHVMVFNAGEIGFGNQGLSRTARRYAHLGRLIGVNASSERNLVLGMIEAVRQLIKKLGIPTKITDLSVTKADFTAAIPELAETALADACTAANPVPVTTADLEKILAKLA